jgi:hypothetical protein
VKKSDDHPEHLSRASAQRCKDLTDTIMVLEISAEGPAGVKGIPRGKIPEAISNNDQNE